MDQPQAGRPVAYSPGSRANRALPAAAGGGGGAASLAVPRSSVEAIFVTETTSTANALPQAALTALSP